MTHAELEGLAKGFGPVIREYVQQEIAKVSDEAASAIVDTIKRALNPLKARLDIVEALEQRIATLERVRTEPAAVAIGDVE